MQGINWGMALPQQNALGNLAQNIGQGFQLGAAVQERKRAGEARNALAAYATNPTEEGLAAIAPHNPEFVMAERGRQSEQQKAQQEQQIRMRAAQGDPEAITQLAGIDFDDWRALGDDQREAIGERTKQLGNAALDVLNLPPEQRQQAVLAYAQQMQSQEIAQIANLPPDQLDAALRSAVAKAEMMQTLIQNERPSYTAIPAGGTLVNTRDPQAVQRFGQGGAQQPRRISTPEEAASLAPGEQYIAPDGTLRVKGGTAGNGGGNFQR